MDLTYSLDTVKEWCRTHWGNNVLLVVDCSVEDLHVLKHQLITVGKEHPKFSIPTESIYGWCVYIFADDMVFGYQKTATMLKKYRCTVMSMHTLEQKALLYMETLR